MELKFKHFRPTSWAVDNKTSMYVLVIIIAIFGILNYQSIPKENMPEIVIPTIMVNTIYPGTSPSDMENLITRPLEKNIKSITGVKTVSSKSVQDFSSIAVEFNTGIELAEAKQKVKDAVDKTKSELPNDLPNDPGVLEINFSDFPIMNINLSGNYPLDKIKTYAEMLQDRIEAQPEITRVDIVGALDREIQIDVDMYKMQAASVTFGEIERAIASENVIIAGGNINMQGMSRSVRVIGEFKDIETIRNISFIASGGAIVKLKEIADVRDSFKERESFARLEGKNVITLNIVKKSGENLLDASDKINKTIDDLKENKFPKDLRIDITNDQSHYTRIVLAELNNTIVIGFVLVIIVLMFFMGVTNAFFVGVSIPLAMALCYIFLPQIDFTLNMLVMFAFIFSLGIVVDDAIVVIENTHRIFMKEGHDIRTAAKMAAGEVFLPIFSGTLTTLAPFFPLAFWPGVVGKFMFFIPITVIIALFASLIVAYIFNPVFAVSFMKRDEEEKEQLPNRKILKNAGIIAAIGVLFHLITWRFLGNFTLFIAISYILHNKYGFKVLNKFQFNFIPAVLYKYEALMRRIMHGRRPVRLMWGLVGVLFFSIFFFVASKPKVVFFPEGEPNNIFVYIKMPVGTDVSVTDSVTRICERRVFDVLGENNPLVKSVISNVAVGASESFFDQGNTTSHLGKVTVAFVEFAKRHGKSTNTVLEQVREAVKGIPGAEITVDKENEGPPTGKPVNIELSGEDLDQLVAESEKLVKHIDSLKVPGMEPLTSLFDNNKPELVINIDRERANREGISTGQIGMEIRTAILGNEVSKYREGEDQYPIQLRFKEYQRKNIDRLMNLKITYRDMNTGLLRQIPLSSVATVNYQNTYGGIDRIDQRRVITMVSNLRAGGSSAEVNIALQRVLKHYELPEGMEVKLTGESEDQEESSMFLLKAMIFSISLILFILITQFNSLSKPVIILSEVLFSISGVFIGYALFGIPFSIIMTGMGVVALAGIVIRNGILLVEFIDELRERGVRTREAIIQGGKIRLTPVFLTAISTILGLIPLAIGFNIDFVGMFADFAPNIHFGSDTSIFFSALSWTIIFGLTFSTILTVLFIPVMYYLLHVYKLRVRHRANVRRWLRANR